MQRAFKHKGQAEQHPVEPKVEQQPDAGRPAEAGDGELHRRRHRLVDAVLEQHEAATR